MDSIEKAFDDTMRHANPAAASSVTDVRMTFEFDETAATGAAALEMGLKGFPERGNSFTTLNASRINRVLFALAAPFMSPPLRARMFLLPGGAVATERAAELLGGAHKVPDFLGGPRAHVLPRTAGGDVDFVELVDRLRKET